VVCSELGLYSYNNVFDVLCLRAKMKPDVPYMVESKFVGFRTRTPCVAIVFNGYGGNFFDAIATNNKKCCLSLFLYVRWYLCKYQYTSLEVQNVF